MTLFGSSSAGTPKRLFEPGDFRRPFLILWAIFILFYFSELASFSLSIDEERRCSATTGWSGRGRTAG